LFVSNDMGAIALQEFMDRHRLRVPEDVSLVGFDNVTLAGLARISLTTIAQPLKDLARLGIQRLVARIEADGRLPAAQHVVTVPVKLVVRGSSGPAPTGAPGRPSAVKGNSGDPAALTRERAR
jgi:LacI family transcriptional regulator